MNKLLKIGTVTLLLVLVLLFGYLYFKSGRQASPKTNGIAQDQAVMNTDSKKVTWINYQYNKLPGISFSMKAPNDLALNEDGEKGTYADFIRFDEVKSSVSTEINLGIREGKMEEEIGKIKKEMETNGVLVDETPLNVDGFPAKKLFFRPKTQEEFEERVLVVVTHDKYAISISTSPSQIDQVLQNFKFTN